jgi:hypothetical protein
LLIKKDDKQFIQFNDYNMIESLNTDRFYYDNNLNVKISKSKMDYILNYINVIKRDSNLKYNEELYKYKLLNKELNKEIYNFVLNI